MIVFGADLGSNNVPVFELDGVETFFNKQYEKEPLLHQD